MKIAALSRAAAVTLAAALGTACAPGLHTREAGAVGPLEVHAVDWNPAKTAVAGPRAVADTGELVAVFADDGSWVFRGGALAGHVTGATGWRDAATIVAADGSPRWIVGVDGKGRLLRLRGASSFEDVSARYGLPPGSVRGATMLDEARVGFLLDGRLAVADGEHVTRYGIDLRALSGNGGQGAAVAKDGVVSVRASDASVVHFALPDAQATAVTRDGHVYAETSRALYAVGDDGALALLYVAPGAQLHGLAAAGDRVWFGDGDELGMARGHVVNETHGAHIAADGKLFASPGGDVWVVGGGHIEKYSSPEEPGHPGVPGDITDPAWTATLEPIFARNCAACHQPGGTSGVDLSSLAAFRARKSDILEQVVTTRAMPPGGRGMSEADRESIHRWITAQAGR